MKRLRKRWGVWLGLFLLVPASPALTLLGPTDLREQILQQLTLKVMAEKITGDAATEQEKALRLLRYVQEHLFTPHGTDPSGESILEVLVRNVAWCSQQSDILAVLARRVWIPGGYVTLYGYDTVSHHTVCGLHLDGALRMLDPQTGCLFFDSEGGIATLEQVRDQGPSLRSPQLEALRRLQGEPVDRYFRLFDPAREWEVHVPSTPIWLKYMDYYYDLLGDPLVIGYQDLFFRIENTDPFTRARMKQLAWRFDEALADYERIIEGGEAAAPPVLLGDYEPLTREVLEAESMFFRGQTLWDMGEHRACIDALEAYLKAHPDNRWRDLACYYLGESARRLGRVEEAAAYFAAIRDDLFSGTPAPERLADILDTAWARPRGADEETGED